MKLFKRKPKCQRRNGKHIWNYNCRCIYCGISVVDLDRESYIKERREISKAIYYSIKKDKQ